MQLYHPELKEAVFALDADVAVTILDVGRGRDEDAVEFDFKCLTFGADFVGLPFAGRFVGFLECCEIRLVIECGSSIGDHGC